MKTKSLLTLVLLISIILSGCNKAPETAAVKAPVKVTLSEIKEVSLTKEIASSALLEAHKSVILSFLQGGYLLNADYDMGDIVNKGDTLASLDTEALKADFLRAEAGLEKAERDYKRALQLFRSEVIPEYQYKDAETGMKTAEAVYQAAKFVLEHGYITAPFSGRITERLAEAGQIAGPGTPIYHLVDDRILELTLGISERDIGLIKKGDSVFINLIAKPSETAKGKITGRPSAGLMTKGVIPVKAQCANPGGWLPGMAVKAVIKAGKADTVTAIPAESVQVSSDGQAYCFRYQAETGQAVKTMIDIGGVIDGLVIVEDGIGIGELVVLQGINRMRDGGQVEVVNADIIAGGK